MVRSSALAVLMGITRRQPVPGRRAVTEPRAGPRGPTGRTGEGRGGGATNRAWPPSVQRLRTHSKCRAIAHRALIGWSGSRTIQMGMPSRQGVHGAQR